MAQRSKLSGAALAAELTSLSFPQMGQLHEQVPAETVEPATSPAPPQMEASGQTTRIAHVRSKRIPAPNPRGGRPAKAGVDGIPLNVRLSQSDHLALAKLAGKLMVPGRPLPTVQDVVRGLIRGALKEPELALRLSNRAD